MITVEEVAYGSAGFLEACEIRRTVFVEEQGVHPDNEFDSLEPTAVHLLARLAGRAAGVARCYGDAGVARIGRVAVLPAHRRHGVGRALMLHAFNVLRQRNVTQVLVHSQTQATKFYGNLGFISEGAEFEEEGIPHVAMTLQL